MRRLAILDDYQGVALGLADWCAVQREMAIDVFREALPAGVGRAKALAPYEAIVAMRERTPFTAQLIEALPRLRLLVTTGMWNRAIDYDAIDRAGITVCGTESSLHAPVELTWALILACARRIAEEDAGLRCGRWQTRVGMELHGKTLGVVGLGRLGREIARIGVAFGMRVVAWSQNLTAQRAGEAGAELVSRQELFRRSDVVSIHLVLGERTRGLVGVREFSLMKPTAILVNTSRGPIVDEDALVGALESGSIGMAALDVFDPEPLALGHRLLATPRTLLTPHIGITTDSNYGLYYRQAVEDISAWLSGTPIRLVRRHHSASTVGG